jgi:hypothetical protein
MATFKILILPIAGLAGFGLFCLTFGTGILNPREFGWMIHGDSAQHYLGWAFFRSSAWHWPLGVIDNFGYPFSTTITYTDSIPLVALPLKVISAFLPVDFNYFGLWMAGCLMLNAVFAAAFLRGQEMPALPALIGAAFFAIAPCLLLRGYGHESLMAQWLILASFLLYQRKSPDLTWRSGWSLLLASALLVHPYFFVMNAAVFIASLVRLVWFERSLGLQRAAVWCLWNSALALFVMYAAGYFYGDDKSLAAVGYPNYSANLLTWLDPMNWRQFLLDFQRDPTGKGEWSKILPPLGHAHPDQYEGFAYLGAGMILLVLLAGFVMVRKCTPDIFGRVWFPLLAAIALLALYSFSTKLTFGSQVVWNLPLSPDVHQFLSVYRASGRFIWPATYLLMLLALVQVWRHLPQRVAALLLISALGLQIYDLSDKMREFRELLGNPQPYQLTLSDPLWEQAMQSATHLIALDDTTSSDEWIAFSILAARRGVPTSAAMVARVDDKKLAAWRHSLKDQVLQGKPQPREVYVSRQTLPAPTAWKLSQANGWWVLFQGSSPER